MRRHGVLLALLLVLATLVVYGRVVGLGFVSYDDPLYVTQNRHVRNGLTGEGIAWALATSEASHYWHPLTWVSHMIDAQIFGLRPAGHHVTNLVLHCASVVLVFFVLKRATRNTGPSLFTALLFAVHPLHAESVAWVAERKDLLSTVFFWLALGAYVLYAERPSPLRYAAVGAAFLFGLLAKPMLVTLPFVLLLMDIWPLRRLGLGARVDGPSGEHVGIRPSPSRSKTPGEVLVSGASWPPGAGRRCMFLILEKSPLFLMAGAVSVLTLRMSAATSLPFERLSLVARVANAIVAYATYIAKTLWPSRLAVIYPHSGMPSTGLFVVCAALLLGMTVWATRERNRRPYLAFGWFWYLGTLVPVIGIVQVGSQALADRYTYIPLTGLFVIAAWSLRDLGDKIHGWRSWRGPSRPGLSPCPVSESGSILPDGSRTMFMIQAACATVILVALSAVTWAQVGHWSSSASLFGHALDVTENNSVAHVGLGNALGESGRPEEASAHFMEALRINPDYGLAHYDLGMNLLRQKRTREAIAQFEQCLRLEPDSVEAHLMLGFALTREGRIGEAIAHYQQCLRLKPDATLALNNLAWIRATSADPAFRSGTDAVNLAERACALAGNDNARYFSTLAAAYAESGRFQDALRSIDRAIALEERLGHAAAVREYRSQEARYRSGQAFRPGEASSSTADG